jgi:hypothetical protein
MSKIPLLDRSDEMGVGASELTVEQRLAAVEREVAELKSLFTGASVPDNWLEKVTGSVTDEAAFREVLELGRAIRASDRPREESDNGP